MSLGSNPVIRLLAIFLMFTGCASTPQHLTEESKNEIKNIAIVSLVPESVNFDKVAITSFSSKYTEFDMGNRVTNSILSVTQERISKSYPGWVVKSIGYDRTAILTNVSSVKDFRTERAKETFADLARKNNLDAILIVRASADRMDNAQQEPGEHYLREGLNVLLKDNNWDGELKLVIRANLSVVIIGKNGDVMAVGTVPAKLDNAETLKPEDYDLSENMKLNHRPEVLAKLEGGVIVDLTRRLNLCFDSLGFAGKAEPEMQRITVVPQPDAVIEPTGKSPAQSAPTTNSFDQCFSRCRQYTDRTKEQCFDSCNK
jgi:hypothetical protein